MSIEMTVLTATLGRQSITGLAKDLLEQTAKDQFVWRVIFDGQQAKDSSYELVTAYQEFIPTIFTQINSPEKLGHYGLLFQVADRITTPYVCIMDDDNRFHDSHIERLINGLKNFPPYVATSRYYTTGGLIVAKESPESELIDSNCIGMTTEHFLKVRDFWFQQGSSPNFIDMHAQMFSLLCGIKPRRLDAAYTVEYEINPNRCPPDEYKTKPGELIFETLSGTFFKVNYDL